MAASWGHRARAHYSPPLQYPNSATSSPLAYFDCRSTIAQYNEHQPGGLTVSESDDTVQSIEFNGHIVRLAV